MNLRSSPFISIRGLQARFAVLFLGAIFLFYPHDAFAAGRIVTLGDFIRAETDMHFSDIVRRNGLGTLYHAREMTPPGAGGVVRPNRDTLYSSGIFDLDAGPVTVTLPDAAGRHLSLQALSEDHYIVGMAYAPGVYEYTREQAGTRYLFLSFRTFADPDDSSDMEAAHAVQDGIKVAQAHPGTFEVSDWDPGSLRNMREALRALASILPDARGMFGGRDTVDPVKHLIGTATGWGGLEASAATYVSVFPAMNDGAIPYLLSLKDVPVDGFWSVSVYDAGGYFRENDRDAYSLNSVTATAERDGSVLVHFGACTVSVPNCLPIMPGWNYTVRLYRPRPEVLNGSWKLPPAVPDRGDQPT